MHFLPPLCLLRLHRSSCSILQTAVTQNKYKQAGIIWLANVNIRMQKMHHWILQFYKLEVALSWMSNNGASNTWAMQKFLYAILNFDDGKHQQRPAGNKIWVIHKHWRGTWVLVATFAKNKKKCKQLQKIKSLPQNKFQKNETFSDYNKNSKTLPFDWSTN